MNKTSNPITPPEDKKRKRKKKRGPYAEYNAYMSRFSVDEAVVDEWIKSLDVWINDMPKDCYTLVQFLKKIKVSHSTFYDQCNKHDKLKKAKDRALDFIADLSFERACANKANWNAVRYGLKRMYPSSREQNLEYEREIAAIKKDSDSRSLLNLLGKSFDPGELKESKE